ncbi:hypothetical protein NDU88_004381 [Pleurodeles waltl]|uniref:Uncharacterized protein n=1 Tax=Pleurodeles waltl TaxID=8319 RepID=A0AAV7MY97_PLEWA|nr:hypothetical protein NDU88_004381 [Pleurodeles waltl]
MNVLIESVAKDPFCYLPSSACGPWTPSGSATALSATTTDMAGPKPNAEQARATERVEGFSRIPFWRKRDSSSRSIHKGAAVKFGKRKAEICHLWVVETTNDPVFGQSKGEEGAGVRRQGGNKETGVNNKNANLRE